MSPIMVAMAPLKANSPRVLEGRVEEPERGMVVGGGGRADEGALLEAARRGRRRRRRYFMALWIALGRVRGALKWEVVGKAVRDVNNI